MIKACLDEWLFSSTDSLVDGAAGLLPMKTTQDPHPNKLSSSNRLNAAGRRTRFFHKIALYTRGAIYSERPPVKEIL